jgi:hypothetical protein
VRQYGVSTANSDGLVPTPWETGYAPYIIGVSACVIVSAALTAADFRYGRHALMALTTIYTLCLYYSEVTLLLSMWHERNQWTVQIILNDFVFFAGITAWLFVTYWGLFKARGLTIGWSDRGAASSVSQGGVDD